jgi:riboflavin-specific deaminase-like protein
MSADQAWTAFVLVRKSQLAGDMHDPASAVDLAEAAARAAGDGNRLRAAGATYKAHGLALAGDPTACLRALDLAHQLVDTPDDGPDAPWAGWLSPGYVAIQRARCLIILGDYPQAAALFSQTIEDIPVSLRRDRGVYLAREALAHAGAGEADLAASTGLRALAIVRNYAVWAYRDRATASRLRAETLEDPAGGRRLPRPARLGHNFQRPPFWVAAQYQNLIPEGGPMAARPYVILSCAMSIDGYIDDTTPERLRLSDEADFDRIDQVRAESDAILIGATTLRRDNPRLIVKSPQRQAERVARGLPSCPLKVTITASGDLSPDLRFWHSDGARLVYCPDQVVAKVHDTLGDLADIRGLGDGLNYDVMLDDLGTRGVRQLMVEGGSVVHTAFLTADLADEIQLAVAPFFVGDSTAPRFVNPAMFPANPAQRMEIVEASIIGDMALLRYRPRRGI